MPWGREREGITDGVQMGGYKLTRDAFRTITRRSRRGIPKARTHRSRRERISCLITRFSYDLTRWTSSVVRLFIRIHPPNLPFLPSSGFWMLDSLCHPRLRFLLPSLFSLRTLSVVSCPLPTPLIVVTNSPGAKIAGHRGYFLTNDGIDLNQALITYGLHFLRARGYKNIQPPFFMNKDMMAKTAQLDQFDEELYKVRRELRPPSTSSHIPVHPFTHGQPTY